MSPPVPATTPAPTAPGPGAAGPLHVFLHVPKTGGSSLRTVLARQYGTANVLYFDLGPGDPRSMDQAVAEHAARFARRPPRLVTGHQYIGLHAALRQPCLYVAMLRDPIDRALSEYFYAFTYPHHRLREEITSGRLGPLDFVAGQRNGTGGQARMLAGRSDLPLEEAALANLRHTLAAVGVAEEYDRTLLLFARRLGWGPPLYVARNVTRLDPAQAEARARARAEAEALRPRHALDAGLHAAARDRLEADIAAEGPAFARAMAAFAALQGELAARAGEEVFDRYEFSREATLPPWAAGLRDSDAWREVAGFLAAPPAPAARPRNLVGELEAREGGLLTGHAADLLDPAPLTLELRAGGSVVATVRAQRRRADLAGRLPAPPGLDAPHCGFVLPLPDGAAGAPGLRLVVAGTGLALPDPRGLLR